MTKRFSAAGNSLVRRVHRHTAMATLFRSPDEAVSASTAEGAGYFRPEEARSAFPDLQIAYLPVFDTLLEGEAPLAEAASAPEAGQSQPAAGGAMQAPRPVQRSTVSSPLAPGTRPVSVDAQAVTARAAATGAPLVRPVSGLSSPVSSAPAVQLQPVSGIRPAPATAGKVQTPEEIAISAAERPSRPATRSGPGRSGAAIPGEGSSTISEHDWSRLETILHRHEEKGEMEGAAEPSLPPVQPILQPAEIRAPVLPRPPRIQEISGEPPAGQAVQMQPAGPEAGETGITDWKEPGSAGAEVKNEAPATGETLPVGEVVEKVAAGGIQKPPPATGVGGSQSSPVVQRKMDLSSEDTVLGEPGMEIQSLAAQGEDTIQGENPVGITASTARKHLADRSGND